MINDHYVVIQEWRPHFRPEETILSTLRVWVRLPGIPFEYFDRTILQIIGDRIGRTVRIDHTTLEGSRGNFARICVEVDLSKPLLSKYRLRRRVRRIEYEGLHTICFTCGCYGHKDDACKQPSININEEPLEEDFDGADKENAAPDFVEPILPVGSDAETPAAEVGAQIQDPPAQLRALPLGLGDSAHPLSHSPAPELGSEPISKNMKTNSRLATEVFHLGLAAIIVEPKISGVKAAKVVDKLGFDSNFRVDAIGFKGGVWLAWNSNLVSFDIVEHGKQFIHAKGVSREGSVFFLTAVYASPKATETVLLWDVLKSLAGSMNDPWAVMGYFNSILSANDKRGGAGFIRARNKSFIDTVDLCGLSDLPFQGPKFTWARNNVLVRLDRALVNDNWMNLFPESSTIHLHKLKSDHRPILLRSTNQVYSPYTKPFRFLSAWLSHPSFKFVLKRKWSRGADLPFALSNLTTDLCHWNKFVFGNIFRRKRRLTEDLKRAEARSSSSPTSSLLAEERAIRSKLEAVLWQEDALWLQKSRSKWVSEGDRNTSYFHLSTLRRRAFNRISRLKDSGGKLDH
ncbi:hypothetical protein LINPERHAP2_LOCUS3150 [Linum perenne]